MIRSILLLTTLICFSPLRIGPIDDATMDENGYYHADGFDYIEFTPLSVEGMTIKFRCSFLKLSYVERSYSVSLSYNDIDVSESIFRESNFEPENYFEIQYKPKYERDAKLKFTIYSKSSIKPLASKEFDIIPVSKEKIYGPLINGHYESMNSSTCYERKKGIYFDKDIIDVSGMDGTYETNSSQKIDLKNFRIKYRTQNYTDVAMPYGDATYVIANIMNAFDDIGRHSYDNSLTNIDLIFKYDKERCDYYLAFKNSQYVNPLTHRMSSTYKDGYIETSYLYLPREYVSQYSTIRTSFVVYGIGINKLILACPLKIITGNKIMGSCSSADYCIKSEDATPNFEIGKVVEH